MKKNAFVSLIVGACAAAGVLIACQQDVSPGISFDAEVGASREALEATQGDGTYEFHFNNGARVSGDCDGIQYNAPQTIVRKDGSTGVTFEQTYVYEYFAADAREWETRFLRAGIDCTIHITHYPHRHCWVSFSSNILVEPPKKM
jgi:hypothetical protein